MSFGFGGRCWCGRRFEYDLVSANLMFCCCLLWIYDPWPSLSVVLRFDVVVRRFGLLCRGSPVLVGCGMRACVCETVVVCVRVFVKRLWCACVCLCDWLLLKGVLFVTGRMPVVWIRFYLLGLRWLVMVVWSFGLWRLFSTSAGFVTA